MLHGKFTIFVTCLLVLVVVASTLVLAEIDSTSADFFGIKDIKEPYRTRITQVLVLASQQSRAIKSSGYTVYYLADIVEANENQKFYTWTNPADEKFVTTHYTGAGVTSMKKGDYFLGKPSPMRLAMILNGEEVRFTLK